ncbi:MAG: hypothetical protein JWQ09_5985 [Segetibacter sp.]|nr:hypothetical protein [Segetibacter sp.]
MAGSPLTTTQTASSQKEIKKDPARNILKNTNITVTISGSSNNYKEDSIIDITNQPPEKINTAKAPAILPYYWKDKAIQSFDDIHSISAEQREYYHTFKKAFVQNVYINLRDNNNYLYLLLFDLLKEFDNGNDLNKLETLINRLGLFYPQIKDYALSCFSDKKSNYNSYVNRNQYYNTEYEYYGLGTRFKTQLFLNDEEVSLLNKVWYPGNNFCSIEYCLIRVIKFYLTIIAALKEKYIREATTLDVQFTAVADIIARKNFKYKIGSQNYKYCIETTTKEFYAHIFKHCENAVREHYGHKRKINTDTFYNPAEAKTEFDTKIILKVTELLPSYIATVKMPDEATDVELYAQNTSRWKIKFEALTAGYNNKPAEFVSSIVALGNLNKKNPSIENIFFEASKFIAKFDRESALSLYIYYLYHDLKSATFDNKQLTKTIQKSLFKTNEQLHDFEIIVSELIKDNNLEKALNSVSRVYELKRKKIKLDTALIKEVQQRHSGTVELLNEYLKDDYEDEASEIKTQETDSEEITIKITQKNIAVQQSAFISSIAFTPIHTTALELFVKSNFAVAQSELEAFARSKGIFKNQLIESINDTCYEFLDDVLIEEEDDYYTINTNYFQSISAS